MFPSELPFLSGKQLRQRKAVRPIDSSEPPSIQEDYRDESSTSFSKMLDFKKLANMVKEEDDEYRDKVGGIEGLLELLGSNRDNGIRGDARDTIQRRDKFGSNTYWWQNQRKPLDPCFIHFMLTSSSSVLLVPAICLSLLALFGSIYFQIAWRQFEAIILVVLVLVLSINMWLCLNAYEKYMYANECEVFLKKADELKSIVMRDGRQMQIPTRDVVVGDVVMLKEGDRIPADGLSLGWSITHYMPCDDKYISKKFSSMLVTSVGKNTQFGQALNIKSCHFHEITTNRIMEMALVFLKVLMLPIRRLNRKTEESNCKIEIVVPDDNTTRFTSLDLEGLQKLVLEEKYDGLRDQFGGVDGVIEALKSHRQNGINGDISDLYHRIGLFGSNTSKLSKRSNIKFFLRYLLKALFGSPCLNIWFPAAITLWIKFKKYGLQDGWIAMSCFSTVITLSIAIAQAEKARRGHPHYKLKKLSKELDNSQVQVVRNGSPVRISISDLVVGDIVRLRKDNQIPADGLFVEGDSLQLEDALGRNAQRDEAFPFMLSGWKVSRGRAHMLVTSVGKNSSWAKTMNFVISLKSSTHKPLQTQLKKIFSHIEKFGCISALSIPLMLLGRHLLGRRTNEDGGLEMYLATIVIMVKNIFYHFNKSIWWMSFSSAEGTGTNAILKNGISDMFEWITAARVTTIITGETSMSTQTRMVVFEYRLNEEIIVDVSSETPSNVLEALQVGVALIDDTNKYHLSEMERAISSWGEFELHINSKELMETYTIEDCVSEERLTWTKIRNRSDAEPESARYVHCRGDAEMILTKCAYYHEKDGTKKPLDEDARIKIKKAIQDMKANGLVCVALANRLVPKGKPVFKDDVGEGSSGDAEIKERVGGASCGEVEIKEDSRGGGRREIDELYQIEEELDDVTLLGIVGLGRKVRKNVESLQNIGIQVKMVSAGDDIANAITIARECGILATNQNIKEAVVEADTLRNCSDEQKLTKIKRLSVMVRSTSSDKLLLVKNLKRSDEVVAVVGRGDDDVHILDEADVGFSMEPCSTEAVTERAEFLILDDSFTSVCFALSSMRLYYCCLILFIHFSLVVKVPVFILNSVATLFYGETCISDFTLFLFDTVESSAHAFALTKKHANEQLKKLPTGRNQVKVIKAIGKEIMAKASFLTMILLLVQFQGETVFGRPEANLMQGILGLSVVLNSVMSRLQFRMVLFHFVKLVMSPKLLFRMVPFDFVKIVMSPRQLLFKLVLRVLIPALAVGVFITWG